MLGTWHSITAAGVVILLVASGCAGSGMADRSTDSAEHEGQVVLQEDEHAHHAASGHVHTDFDVHFMQMMIPHHAQALEMTALVPNRSSSEAVQVLARRIELSQADEIEMMERWLRDRGEDLPEVQPTISGHGAHHHHQHHHQHSDAAHAHDDKPGMLSPDQMTELSEARGVDFDRLFLELMIFHHEGALTMVEELLAAEGAAQDTEIFRFASHVEADQYVEIQRMRSMLADLPNPDAP